MKTRTKQLLLALFALTNAKAAFAASAPALFAPIIDLFGPEGFAGIYTPGTELFWDSVLALIIFIGVAQMAFKKTNMGKAMPIVLGIVLTAGFIFFEASEKSGGFRLGKSMAPLAILLVFLIFAFFVHVVIQSVFGIKNKWISWLAGITAMLWVLPQPVVWYLQEISPLFSWVFALTSIFSIVLLILVIRGIAGLFKGGAGGGVGSFISEPSRFNPDVKELGRSFDNWNSERRQRNSQQKQQGIENARQAGRGVRQRIEQDMLAEARTAQEGEKALDLLSQNVQVTLDFAKGVVDTVAAYRNEPGFNMNEYREQVRASKANLEQYFNQQNAFVLPLERIGKEETPQSVAFSEQAAKNLSDLRFKSFKEDKEDVDRLVTGMQIVKAAYERSSKTIAAVKSEGADTSLAARFEGDLATEYQKHEAAIGQVREKLLLIENVVNNAKKQQDAFRTARDQRNKIVLEEQGKQLGLLKGHLMEYRVTLLSCIDEGTSDSFSRLNAVASSITETISRVRSSSQNIERLAQQGLQALEQLEAEDQQYARVSSELNKQLDAEFSNKEYLLQLALAAEATAQAASRSHFLSPAKISQKDMGLNEMTDISKVNNREQFRTVAVYNAEKAKKRIMKDEFLLNIEKQLADAVKDRAAASTPGGQHLATALNALVDMRTKLIKTWEDDLLQKAQQNEQIWERTRMAPATPAP